MDITKCTLECSVPLAFFTSTSGIHKRQCVHNVLQGDKNSQNVQLESPKGFLFGHRTIEFANCKFFYDCMPIQKGLQGMGPTLEPACFT